MGSHPIDFARGRLSRKLREAGDPAEGEKGYLNMEPKTAEESPPGGGVMDETDCSRLADNAELTKRQGQAYSQRSESPRFREESLHLGMRAAVDQVL
jgi:hypothetical protein